MPKLRTLINQPMNSSRLLTKDPKFYPITTQNLQGGLNTIGSQMTQATHLLLHLGLSAGHDRAPGQLTRFYYVDTYDYSLFPNLRFEYLPSLFTSLTHLDMCISNVHMAVHLQDLSNYIMASKDLIYLRLCFERGRQIYEEPDGQKTAFEILLDHPDLYLPKLRSLYIHDMGTPKEPFMGFIKKRMQTLKSLIVEDDLPSDTIFDLVEIISSHELELEEFAIIPSDWDSHWPLNLINKLHPDPPPREYPDLRRFESFDADTRTDGVDK
ncbi:uncharacterized protein F4822DRAFT_342229 [Hypoxylon trugodes]|uniref:uncharacterized protein n=1 Tax=Hypoxylon trugodes TaxID=326681 RepID=UPI0021A04B01|nr:uncharacterized protein F4822DRAFT_342229 [Hypoxylon trugodes]KAI1385361.1 hypothetical protein F4822DRAFT_342229 [Hypoxylon trugodes]